MSSRVLVVGAGPAGLRCAETLTAGGHRGTVTLVGEEPRPPYERPALSKAFLAGERRGTTLALRTPAELTDRGIDVLLGRRVARIAPGRAELADGGELAWDTLVLATGARARTVPRLSSPRTHTLRTLADARRLRRSLRPGTRLAIVGSGFVGCEVATTALGLGVDVVLVDPAPTPLHRPLGAAVGAIVADRLGQAGASLRLGTAGLRFDGRSLRLSSGDALDCDAVLVGVGAEPAGELVGPGAIPTDDCGRTAQPGVYACGDVASWEGRRDGHWTTAIAQGAAVATAILGNPEPFRTAPYAWSDVAGLRLQLVGSPERSVGLALDGDEDAFTARYADGDGRTVAVLLANRPTEVAGARHELAAAA